jgi:hypothetical protein
LETARLAYIGFDFVQDDADTGAFLAVMRRLLGEVPGSQMARDGAVLIGPADPPGALPVTRFRWAQHDREDPSPRLSLITTAGDTLFELPLTDGAHSWRASANREERGDAAEVHGDEDALALLPIDALYQRLRGHVVRLDHTGVNLPTGDSHRRSWEMLNRSLAASGNFYRYPSGEPWHFLIPATDEEFLTDIRSFTVDRGPKFELVHDSTLRHPLIQIDIHTDLPRIEIERRFPAPYGVALPGLEPFFRSVYLSHPWPGLSLRVDLRYRDDSPPSTWDTGEWLVTAGGRIR